MATKVGICNRALIKIGAEPIISLTDNSKAARICNESYEVLRDDLLMSHPWNFAIKRVELTLTGNTPVSNYANQFVLPADYLRVLVEQDTEHIDFQIEGPYLVTNEGAYTMKYIAKVDEGKFTPKFSEALAYTIASELCFSITQSNSTTVRIEDRAKKYIAEARSFDAQEGTPPAFFQDTWIESRY